MKYIVYILFLIPSIIYGQYKLDNVIKNHPFFKTVDTLRQCRMHNVYYEQQDGYGINGARMDCYLLQEQLKDSLRAIFSDKELFEIAQYSKITFYRIAAFELYSQTNYLEEEVINFLKQGKIPTSLSSYNVNDTVPEMYIPMPNSLLPQRASVRLKMLGFLNPAAKRSTQKDSLSYLKMINVPAYPKTKPLDLENYVSLLCYMRYYTEDRLDIYNEPIRILKPGEKKPKMPTFYILQPVIEFGTIDFNYIDAGKKNFELHGAIKVKNNTTDTITLTGQASGHTMCLKWRYIIPPKKEMMVEFKSLVELYRPRIERTITLQNVKTGEAQVFTFKANFINTKKTE